MSYFSSDITIVSGKAAKDAEMRFMPDGTAVTKFSIPVDRSFKGGDGEYVKRTIWYNIEVFGPFAETVNQRVNKGAAVSVRGRLNADPVTGGPRMWTGQDGAARTSFELRADRYDGVTFLGETPSNSGDGQPQAAPVDDGIPF